MSKTPQEPKRLRWPWKRDVEQSAPTHTHHTHCASSLLGTTADQRYDVPQDWLREGCQGARVRWGTCCEGFCSKEGPHYQMDWSARNQLECVQVQRALGKLSRSCHQTSNNQPWFTSLEIPWGFLSQAVLRWFRQGSCHMRKCQFKDIMWEEKVWFAIAQWTFAWETFGKRRNGESAGTNSCTRFPQASCFEKMRHVCQKYGGACTTWYSENQRYEKMEWEIGFPHSQERCKKLVSSDYAKILDKESSDKD